VQIVAEAQKIGIRIELDTSSVQAKAPQAAQAVAAMGASMQQAAQGTRTSLTALNTEQEKFISGLQRQIETVGMSKAQLLEFKSMELGVTDQAKGMIAQLQAGEAAFKKQAGGAHGAGAAMEGFSLKSSVARRELMVMTRELARGDFTRLSTSASIFAQSSGLVTTLMSPLGLAIGAVAVVMGGLAAAFLIGDSQSKAFARSMALTGNYAGITEGQFNSLAGTVAKSSGATIGSAREVAEALASSGRFSGKALGATAIAAEMLARASGKSTDDIVKDFIGMTDGVAKWSEKTNESYHFLTAAQLEHIKLLEDQGDKEKAITEVMDILSGKLQGVSQNLGMLENAWHGVKSAASSAIAAMLQIGRVKTPEQHIADLKETIATAGKPRASLLGVGEFGDTSGKEYENGDQTNNQETLRLAIRAKDNAEVMAAIASKTAQSDQASIQFGKLKEQSLSRQEKLTKALSDANALADKGHVSKEDRAQVLADINERYKPAKGAKPVDTTRRDESAQLALDLEGYKKDLSAETDASANAQKILEAQHSAGLVEEKDYYAQRRQFIDTIEHAQENALQKQIARLQKETFAGNNATADRLKNQRQIVDLQAQLVKDHASADTQNQVLDIQQEARNKAVALSFLNARDAAEKYLDSLRRGQQRDLAGFGAGTEERNRTNGRAQIDDKYDQQRRDLEKSRRDAEFVNPQAFAPGTDAQKKYSDELGLITEFQRKALESYDQYYAQRRQLESNSALGAQEALKNYATDAADTYKHTQQIVTNSFKGMEDALVAFVSTGKLDFQSLINSIISDLARLAIKQAITGPLSAALSGVFRGAGGGISASNQSLFEAAIQGYAKANANGGVYDSPSLHSYANEVHSSPQMFAFANGAGIFGEAGPEAIMPLTRDGSGRLGVTAHGAGGGAASATTVAPVTHITIDSRSDRGAVYADINRALTENNKTLMDHLRRVKVLPQ